MRLPVYGLPMVILAQKAAFGMQLVVVVGAGTTGSCWAVHGREPAGIPALP